MLSILVVEESQTGLQMVGEVLEGAGHRVLKATHGEEALRLAAEAQPDLILVGEVLPTMDGPEICRKIKTAPETAAIPVVMLIREAKASERLQVMEHGPDDTLTKPFDVQALLALINRYGSQSS